MSRTLSRAGEQVATRRKAGRALAMLSFETCASNREFARQWWVAPCLKLPKILEFWIFEALVSRLTSEVQMH